MSLLPTTVRIKLNEKGVGNIYPGFCKHLDADHDKEFTVLSITIADTSSLRKHC